jgi:hypothetical protein
MACKIELINPEKNKSIKFEIIDESFKTAQDRVDKLNLKLNSKPNKKELFWVVSIINI